MTDGFVIGVSILLPGRSIPVRLRLSPLIKLTFSGDGLPRTGSLWVVFPAGNGFPCEEEGFSSPRLSEWNSIRVWARWDLQGGRGAFLGTVAGGERRNLEPANSQGRRGRAAHGSAGGTQSSRVGTGDGLTLGPGFRSRCLACALGGVRRGPEGPGDGVPSQTPPDFEKGPSLWHEAEHSIPRPGFGRLRDGMTTPVIAQGAAGIRESVCARWRPQAPPTRQPSVYTDTRVLSFWPRVATRCSLSSLPVATSRGH